MNITREQLRLYAVTDRSWLGEETLYEQVEKALRGGVTLVQLREKELAEEDFEREAKELLNLCHRYQVPLVINDNVSLAKRIGADGVHIGQGDMQLQEARALLGADKIIGVTAKTIGQAQAAEAAGADYLGSGAVFGSSTKRDAKPMDHALLQEICESVAIPVVAIGGITADNVVQLKGRGMAGVAVVSGIFACADIEMGTRRLRELVDEMIAGTRRMRTALTIAGSDSSGGAGIQADIKTMTTNGVYAMSAITALTAQNTLGVTDIMEVTPQFLAEQLDAVFTDIRPDAVKTGMVSSGALIETIADKLEEYHATNIVVDPVMVATSGARLISEDAIEILKKRLLPLATLLTPNIPEAQVLAGMEICGDSDMEKAAENICHTYGCAVLLKGGHQLSDANDLLFQPGKAPVWFRGRRIDNPNTHGTGCTLSSAIASNLAKGHDLHTSVQYAKNYISGALAAMLDLGHGSGPMNHAFAITGEYNRENEEQL
jgi:hydroxymethylpyrimidine kinase/phosphomethylpyrimidine kinase/thiamine-phosphate diphosphorylase